MSAASALCLTGAAVLPAAAEPVYPSQEQVDDARERVADTASQVGAIEGQLAAASARLEQLQVAAAVAAEDYNAAIEALAEKKAAAEAARTAADGARNELEDARLEVGRLAATSYRQGAGMAGLQAFLSAGGPQELLDRAAAMDALGARRQRAYQRMDAASLVARLLDEQAQAARAAQEEAARRASQARASAQRAADAAASEVAVVEADRARLITQLAELRQTSVAMERRRQDGLERERREREEAAARAAAERREAEERRERERQERERRERDAASRAASRAPAAPARPAAPNPAPSPDPEPTSNRAPDPTPAPAPPPSSTSSASAGQAAVGWARQQLGKPYLWAASGPDSFDCSGLTSQAWLHGGGTWIGRDSRTQYRNVTKIGYSQLRPGDLIFYGTSPATIYHVTMYIGNGQMIEAPSAGKNVRITPVRMANAMPYAGRA